MVVGSFLITVSPHVTNNTNWRLRVEASEGYIPPEFANQVVACNVRFKKQKANEFTAWQQRLILFGGEAATVDVPFQVKTEWEGDVRKIFAEIKDVVVFPP